MKHVQYILLISCVQSLSEIDWYRFQGKKMCGFTGWFDPDPREKEILQKMTRILAHRGPDGEGIYFEGPVALGHRRLAVIDLAASSQPMISEGGRYALAYNGELYNFRELRKELEELGQKFKTSGDTEVVLQAMIVWGEEALARFQGMFAFAFWDRKEEKLVLARDPLGIKPLYFSWDGKKLLFASEIKALLVHPDLSKEIDPKAISLYLECQYIPAPFTIYRQIRKLPAAHFLTLQRGKLVQSRYWMPTYLPKFDFDEGEAIERLEAELKRSVASMLVADVPIACFVSGGIDSSLVASMMQAEREKPIQLFHLGFDGNVPSEHEFAAKVASHIGAEYHPLIVNERDVLGMLESWAQVFDEPLGDQAALPTMLLSQLTSRSVKVVLTGEGADEVFAGYSNYGKRLREAPLAARLGSRFSPLPLLYPLFPVAARKNRVFKAAARPLPRRYTTIPNLFDRELHRSYLDSSLNGSLGLEHLAEGHFTSCDSDEYLDKMLHIDINLWLADDLLTKVDRSTMGFSLEARVPYLDHRLVEFAARLPCAFKLRGREGKYLLKKVAERGWLPPEIVWRSKAGFVMPLREWLADKLKPMMNEALSEGGLLGRKIFKRGIIERLRREEEQRKRGHATRLWGLLALELWFRRYAPDYQCN